MIFYFLFFFFFKPSAPKAETLTSGSDSESAFKPSPNIGGYTLNIKNSRGHSFTAKTVIKPEMCTPCGKRLDIAHLNFGHINTRIIIDNGIEL